MMHIDMRGVDAWQTKENNFRVALAFARLLPNAHGARKHIRDIRRRYRKSRYAEYCSCR